MGAMEPTRSLVLEEPLKALELNRPRLASITEKTPAKVIGAATAESRLRPTDRTGEKSETTAAAMTNIGKVAEADGEGTGKTAGHEVGRAAGTQRTGEPERGQPPISPEERTDTRSRRRKPICR